MERLLHCGLLSYEVRFGPRSVVLRLPPGHCCDMGGAITIATTLLPSCWEIDTWSGDVRDTGYKRASEGTWYVSRWT